MVFEKDERKRMTRLGDRICRNETWRGVAGGRRSGRSGLLTLHAANALSQADVIVHDALVNADCLKLARTGAVLEYAGKRGGKPSPKQRDISLGWSNWRGPDSGCCGSRAATRSSSAVAARRR
jgi:hypothetical protein